MTRLLQLFKKYPLVFAAAVLFVPVFIHNPDVAAANFAALLISITGCYLCLQPDKYQKIAGAVSVLVFFGLYLFLPFDNYAFLYTAIAVAAALALVYLAMRLGVSDRQKNISNKILLAGLIIVVLLPLLGKGIWLATNRGDLTQLNSFGQKLESRVDSELASLEAEAAKVADDTFIGDLLQKQQYPELLGYLQNYMVSNNLSYFAVLGTDNKVIARAHNPEMIGDDYALINPSIADTGNTGGMYQEGDKMFIARVIEIKKDKTAAKIIIGKFLDRAVFSDLMDNVAAFAWLNNGDLINQNANGDYQNLLPSLTDGGQNNFDNSHYFKYRGKDLLIGNYHFGKYSNEIIIALPKNYHNPLTGYMWTAILLTGIILTLVWAVAYRYVSKANSRSSFFRIRRSSWINRVNLIPPLALLLLLTALVLYKSGTAYLAQKAERKTIVDPTSTADVVPYLELELPQYLANGQEFAVKVKADNIALGTATVRVSLKYPTQLVQAKEISVADSACDTIFDRSIDANQGYINFSCVMKRIETENNAPRQLTEIKYTCINTGIAAFSLDQAYSNIMTDKGESNRIKQSTAEGDNMLIY